MQVNNYNRNQISFGSKRIIPVIVRDMNDMPVKAWFSKLRLSDPVDIATMEKVNENWNKNKGVYLADDVHRDFHKEIPVYAIELDSNESLYDKLLCLASMIPHDSPNKFYLENIQASPNSSFEAKENRKYKGAGTALMYGLVKIAKKSNAKRFELCSVTGGFYKKLGMSPSCIFRFFNAAGMADFLKKQEAEFKALIEKING